MNKNKIFIAPTVLNVLVESNILTEQEKLKFLKYIGYMTYKEQMELCRIV